MSKIKVKKQSIKAHSHKMMNHPVRSEPSRSSGGHSPHASYPLPHDHYQLPGRAKGKRSSAAKSQSYAD
jgi:hypothetical protein